MKNVKVKLDGSLSSNDIIFESIYKIPLKNIT